MHSKSKGNIGEAAAILAFTKMGYNVFKELGDLSRIDLIIEKQHTCWRIQCKAIMPRNGGVQIKFSKSGPNYRFSYKENDFDIMTIYNLANGELAYLPATIIREQSNITLRVIEAANEGGTYPIRYFSDYINFYKCLEKLENDRRNGSVRFCPEVSELKAPYSTN
jgi:hypothetical protein